MAIDRQDDYLRGLGHRVHVACALVLVAGVALVYLLLLDPLIEKRRGMQAETLRAAARIARRPQLEREHARLTARRDELRQQAALLGQRVLPQPREAEFLSDVSRLAAEAGVTLRDFRPASATRQRGYSRMEVEVSGEATFASLCRLLDRIQQLPRLSRVAQINISAEESGYYPVEMKLVIYFDLQPDVVAASAGEVRRG